MCEETELRSIGHELKAVNHLMQRQTLQSASERGIDRVAVMHGWVIAYLEKHSGTDVYQKDIESAFGIARSTVTGIVKSMESNGYIRRVSVDSDARLKKLVLTDEGRRTHEVIREAIENNERLINNLLTVSEREELVSLVRKLRTGLEDAIRKGDSIC